MSSTESPVLIDPTGIAGLDTVLRGGFPSGRATIVAGGPGTGKTVLAMQYLAGGALARGEDALMISFEESPSALQRNFGSMTWAQSGVIERHLHFVDGRPTRDATEAGPFDLEGLMAIASALVREHDIKRVALDGIDALFAMSDDPANRRRELVLLLQWLAEWGLTTVMTVRASSEYGQASSVFDLAEYSADGVIQLTSTRIGDFSRRVLRVIKMRGASYLRGAHPYMISEAGMRLLPSPTRSTMNADLLDARRSSGIGALDRMLLGGYRPGTTTLISGLPGTAKTTLCAAFLAAGCALGERGLYIGFDEPAQQFIVDVASVGIDLRGPAQTGLLWAESFLAGSAICDEHYFAIAEIVAMHKPVRVVIDPLSAFDKAGGTEIAGSVIERLVALLKSLGITAVFTTVTEAHLGELESTPTRVSTIADTWIHLSFANLSGERNRTLTIVKSRGTAHSNQMRELILSDAGIDLADVFSIDGAVLVGTARMQRERQVAAEIAEHEERVAVQLADLDRDASIYAEDARAIQNKLERLGKAREALLAWSEAARRKVAIGMEITQSLRHGDPEP